MKNKVIQSLFVLWSSGSHDQASSYLSILQLHCNSSTNYTLIIKVAINILFLNAAFFLELNLQSQHIFFSKMLQI